jgi:hypothetical protein
MQLIRRSEDEDGGLDRLSHPIRVDSRWADFLRILCRFSSALILGIRQGS